MKIQFLHILLAVSILASCSPNTAAPPEAVPAPVESAAAASPLPPAQTATPALPTLTPAFTPEMLDRPVFLDWPLPSYVGTARISQYPNSPWSWHTLGLNEGCECPPMFGYLLNLDSLPYWRDTSVPEEQDKAQADPHQFQMVACYSPHAGTDIKALAGTPVYAAADGRVQEWNLNGLNSMLVLKHCLGAEWDAEAGCPDGRQFYSTYMHIIPDPGLLQENREVPRGARLGEIYDQTINSHLHFEVGYDQRSYQNYLNPWGQDAAPWLGCMWLDQSLCTTPAPDYQQLVFAAKTGKLFFQCGSLPPVEIPALDDIQSLRLAPDLIAALTAEGRLFVLEGISIATFSTAARPGWVLAARDVLGFDLAGSRIAILDRRHTLSIKQNGSSLEDPWVRLADHVQAFSISEHRIGYLTEKGELFVQEGGPDNSWTAAAVGIQAFQVIDNRLGFIDRQGTLYVNEGPLSSEYEQIAGSVRAFQLSNVRLGIIDEDNNLLVQEGNLRGELEPLAGQVASFQLADNRILMLNENGNYYYKEGNLFKDWTLNPRTDTGWISMNANTAVFIP